MLDMALTDISNVDVLNVAVAHPEGEVTSKNAPPILPLHELRLQPGNGWWKGGRQAARGTVWLPGGLDRDAELPPIPELPEAPARSP